MATHRLIHVTRTGNDTDGLAEFTNADTVLITYTFIRPYRYN
jgi:hypothetical protein